MQDYEIEDLINDASNISNAELFDVLEDDDSLTFIFNDFLDKEDEFIRDVNGHFSGFDNKEIIIHNEEKPFLIECTIQK